MCVLFITITLFTTKLLTKKGLLGAVQTKEINITKSHKGVTKLLYVKTKGMKTKQQRTASLVHIKCMEPTQIYRARAGKKKCLHLG